MGGDKNNVIKSPTSHEQSLEPQNQGLSDGVKTEEELVEPSSSQRAGMSGAAKGFWGNNNFIRHHYHLSQCSGGI